MIQCGWLRVSRKLHLDVCAWAEAASWVSLRGADDWVQAERYGMEEEAADTLPEIDNNAPLPDLANCMGGEERPPMPPAEHHPTATVSQYEVRCVALCDARPLGLG